MFFEELWKEWVVPAGITLRNFTVPGHWHELYADWKEGLKQLPRSLQAADKALLQSVGDLVRSCYNAEVLECGSWFVPGGVLKAGKVGRALISAGKVRHGGFIKGLREMEDRSVQKAVRSYRERVEEHVKKIEGKPKSEYVPHWRTELKTFREQLDLAEQEARRRGLP